MPAPIAIAIFVSVKNLTMTRSKKRQAAVAADISNEASDDRHADGAKKRVTSRYWTPQVRNGHDASRVINRVIN